MPFILHNLTLGLAGQAGEQQSGDTVAVGSLEIVD
jgi:hypothetical protein